MAEVIRYVDTDATPNGNDGTTWEKAYLTLQACIAAEATNLDTANNWLHIYCKASSGTVDTTQVIISGYTTSAADYILIEAVEGHEAVKDGWKTDRYRLEVTDLDALTISEDYVRIKGLQIKFVHSAGAESAIRIASISATNNDVRIENCRLIASSGQACIEAADGDLNLSVFNTILTGGDGVRMTVATALLYHCIAYGCDDGFELDSATVATAKNCAAFNCADDFAQDAGTFTVDYCAADDDINTEFSATHNVIAPTWADVFENAAGGDFTLKVGASLRGAGIALVGGPAADIDGDAWAAPPSLGADEYVVPDLDFTELHHVRLVF